MDEKSIVKPEIIIAPPPEHGPVLVTIEYEIAPKDAKEFRKLALDLKAVRLRHGAKQWGLFVDIENPTIHREFFLNKDWASCLAQDSYASSKDIKVINEVYAFHTGESSPKISIFAYCNQLFPTAQAQPFPKVYPATAEGTPLWFSEP